MVISSNVFKNKAFVVAFDDSAHFVEHHFKLLPLFISELLQTFFREHTSKIINQSSLDMQALSLAAKSLECPSTEFDNQVSNRVAVLKCHGLCAIT